MGGPLCQGTYRLWFPARRTASRIAAAGSPSWYGRSDGSIPFRNSGSRTARASCASGSASARARAGSLVGVRGPSRRPPWRGRPSSAPARRGSPAAAGRPGRGCPSRRRRSRRRAVTERWPIASGTCSTAPSPWTSADEAAVIGVFAHVAPGLVPTVLGAGEGRLLLAHVPGEDCWGASPETARAGVSVSSPPRRSWRPGVPRGCGTRRNVAPPSAIPAPGRWAAGRVRPGSTS